MIFALANQSITIEWWELSSGRFELFISELVYVEAARGHEDAAARRIAILDTLQELEVTDAVKNLVVALMKEGSFPVSAEMDAYHIAVAAVHGMDYLLTWNCKHIANAVLRPKVEAVCRHHGYEPPVICTPQELMEE